MIDIMDFQLFSTRHTQSRELNTGVSMHFYNMWEVKPTVSSQNNSPNSPCSPFPYSEMNSHLSKLENFALYVIFLFHSEPKTNLISDSMVGAANSYMAKN